MNWGIPMDKRELDDLELDALFASARGQDTLPSGDLMERVLSDALAVQTLAQANSTPAAPRRRWWQAAWMAVGGWPAMAGLATAGVAGIWIGVSPPEGLSDSASALFALETDGYLVDVTSGFSLDLAEG